MSKTLKIPKKIAGVKIPKALRKGPIGEFVASRAGRLVIAEALAVVVAALAARKTEAGQHAAALVRDRASELGDSAEQNLEAAGERIAAAFRAALTAFREVLQESPAVAVSAPAAEDGEASAKKRSASSARTGRSTH